MSDQPWDKDEVFGECRRIWLEYPQTWTALSAAGVFLGMLLSDGALGFYVYEYAERCYRISATRTISLGSLWCNMEPSEAEIGLGEITMTAEELPTWLEWCYGAAHGFRPKLRKDYLWTREGARLHAEIRGHAAIAQHVTLTEQPPGNP